MLTWDHDKHRICQQVERNPATLKIVLKTKDDYTLLRPWISHHTRVVGPENIVIADNGSTDQRTLDTYGRLDPDTVLFQFHGDHNELHAPMRFPELHLSLERSAKYTAMIDTDEFLYRFSNGALTHEASMLDVLREFNSSFPAAYLYGVPTRLDAIRVPDSLADFISNLLWGKPLVRSSQRDSARSCNHNVQFDPSIFELHAFNAFALLHHDRYSTEQRMVNNRNKLAARGLISGLASFQDVARLEVPAAFRAGAGRWVVEMQELLASPGLASMSLGSTHLLMSSDGRLQPDGCPAQEHLRHFLTLDPDLLLESLAQGHQAWAYTA